MTMDMCDGSKVLDGRLTLRDLVAGWIQCSLSAIKQYERRHINEGRLSIADAMSNFGPVVGFSIKALLVLVVVLQCMLASSIAAGTYTFTDRSGRTLDAVILKYDGSAVEVRRLSDGRRFEMAVNTLSDQDQRYLEDTYAAMHAVGAAAPAQLIPGENVLLEFPELGNMAQGQSAQCELSIPKNYDPVRSVPLFVWFSGGKGSHRVAGAKGLVDFDQFLVLSLPYPEGRLPRLAIEAGGGEINTFWEFQRPMLERVVELVPNISEKVRIAGGASSGGHLIGSALDQELRGFCDFFTGFILHEGGYSPQIEYDGTRSSHDILIVYGENSHVREWQDYFMQRIDKARGRIDYIEVENAGHGLNRDGKQAIREWIEKTFSKDLN